MLYVRCRCIESVAAAGRTDGVADSVATGLGRNQCQTPRQPPDSWSGGKCHFTQHSPASAIGRHLGLIRRSLLESSYCWVLPIPRRHVWIVVKVLLYVHRNRRFITDGSPGRPPRLSHSSWALRLDTIVWYLYVSGCVLVGVCVCVWEREREHRACINNTFILHQSFIIKSPFCTKKPNGLVCYPALFTPRAMRMNTIQHT